MQDEPALWSVLLTRGDVGSKTSIVSWKANLIPYPFFHIFVPPHRAVAKSLWRVAPRPLPAEGKSVARNEIASSFHSSQ